LVSWGIWAVFGKALENKLSAEHSQLLSTAVLSQGSNWRWESWLPNCPGDPEAVVLGGGLGLAGGRYRSQLEESFRQYIYSDCQRDLPLLDAKLGPDAGWIGAALCAQRFVKRNDSSGSL
jgi:hypothetical protein